MIRRYSGKTYAPGSRRNYLCWSGWFDDCTRASDVPRDKARLLEKSDYMSGITRTVGYKGNRINIGPHRFFSKSNHAMDW